MTFASVGPASTRRWVSSASSSPGFWKIVRRWVCTVRSPTESWAEVALFGQPLRHQRHAVLDA